MAQIFHPSMNTIARATIFGAVFVVVIAGWLGYQVQSSPYITGAGVVRDQPVPFSHEHHVKGLGVDCRYCHTSVEDSSFAGIPPTETCMTCHSKVWTNAKVLQPIRTSWQENRPLRDPTTGEIGWNRVHNLPDFVYFNHSIHVNKGVGCTSCHGKVNEMPLMYQEGSLQMEWCLDCHRNPEKHLRPRKFIFDMDYTLDTLKSLSGEPADEIKRELKVESLEHLDQKTVGERLADTYHVAPQGHLVSCFVCHR